MVSTNLFSGRQTAINMGCFEVAFCDAKCKHARRLVSWYRIISANHLDITKYTSRRSVRTNSTQDGLSLQQ